MRNKKFRQNKRCVLCGLILLCGLVLSCGNKKPPTGGPKDTTSPEIIDIEPSNSSKKFPGNEIEILFSEPINPNSFADAFTIYPNILEKKFSWNNKKVKIIFNENLIPQQTYHITIDNHCEDLRHNHLENIFHSSFSTGNFIEKNTLFVDIFLENNFSKKDAEILISLFTKNDTTLVAKTNSQKNEKFEISNLAEGEYLISAFQDIDKNLEFDEQIEPFSEKIFNLSSEKIFIELHLVLMDTTKPKLKKISSKSRQHLVLEFSEKIKQIENCKIYNSENPKYELKIIETMLIENELNIITSIPDSGTYKLFVYKFEDQKGNITQVDSLKFRPILNADTTSLNIKNYSPEDGTTVDNLHPNFYIEFNKMIPVENVNVDLRNCENDAFIKVDIRKIGGNKFEITPQKSLSNYVPYKLVICNDCADYEGNELEEKIEINILPIIVK